LLCFTDFICAISRKRAPISSPGRKLTTETSLFTAVSLFMTGGSDVISASLRTTVPAQPTSTIRERAVYNIICLRVMSNFFKELKIIELAGVLAGPGVGLFFAELGARVLKVENKNVGGDATRTWRLAGETPNGPSAYFSSVNYKKEYLFLDLTSAADREKLLGEIASADIVISNYSSRVAQKLSMDYPSLRAVNQELIYLQLDGFANSNRPAYDVVLQAETGWISMTGHPENPSKLPVALIDVLAGHQLKEGALLALIHRMKTGEGSLVHCNLEQAS